MKRKTSGAADLPYPGDPRVTELAALEMLLGNSDLTEAEFQEAIRKRVASLGFDTEGPTGLLLAMSMMLTRETLTLHIPTLAKLAKVKAEFHRIQ